MGLRQVISTMNLTLQFRLSSMNDNLSVESPLSSPRDPAAVSDGISLILLKGLKLAYSVYINTCERLQALEYSNTLTLRTHFDVVIINSV